MCGCSGATARDPLGVAAVAGGAPVMRAQTVAGDPPVTSAPAGTRPLWVYVLGGFAFGYMLRGGG